MNKATPLPPVKKLGRPTKFTPETRARLIELIARGTPITHACNAMRVSFQSFSTYREQHPEFLEDIQVAVAAAIEKRLKVIEAAADAGDINAAKWFLERCHSQFFGRTRVELSGPDGSPLAGNVAIFLPQKDGGAGVGADPVVTTDPVKEIAANEE